MGVEDLPPEANWDDDELDDFDEPQPEEIQEKEAAKGRHPSTGQDTIRTYTPQPTEFGERLQN